MDGLAAQLQALYGEPSKHHGYQSVPDFVSAALDYRPEIDEGWRGDRCRLAYALEHLPLAHVRALTDIGANTGFFALSLAHRFPHLQVSACEPNRAHAKFVRTVAGAFHLPNLEVVPKGVTLKSLPGFQRKDAVLLLNVLHHAGYDFDQGLPRTRDAFTAYAVQYLAALATKRALMLFQMGSNWGGDKANPLVERDRHMEKLRYIAALLVDGRWRLAKVAYPARQAGGSIGYVNLPEAVVQALNADPVAADEDLLAHSLDAHDLNQFPGEFYKRPLVVCVSTTLMDQPDFRHLAARVSAETPAIGPA
jgi:hypothetical protein